jgi:hypothetical protein
LRITTIVARPFRSVETDATATESGDPLWLCTTDVESVATV